MLDDKIVNEFLQWQKDTGRMNCELTDVVVNDGGNIKIEKKMAWVCHITPNDWKEFCHATNREYEGIIQVLAIY